MNDAEVAVYDFHAGSLPLLVSIPHAGVEVPAAIRDRYTAVGRELPDTDWYVDRLYEFARGLGACIIKANYSRYVVDLNRAPDSQSLYPGSVTSAVCPTKTFADEPIYARDEPGDAEIQQRIERYWQPYHLRIAEELARIKAAHRRALLWDAHSIPSVMPGLFAGTLPAFNFGTRDDRSCPREISAQLLDLVQSGGVFTAVLNGRFKGGYITLHHGRPAEGVFAVQLELSQRTYMNENPRGDFDASRARSAAACIERLLQRFLAATAAEIG